MKGKINFFLIFSFFCFSINIYGQNNIEQSDSEAKQLLERLSTKMDKYKAYRVDFDMLLDVPDQEDESQTGFLLHSGNRFVFDIPSQRIVANDKSVFVYLKKEKEIQINDPDFGDDGSLLSPAQMMRLYETEDFVFVITDQNETKTTIEFKPTDEYSDYSKVKVVIDRNSVVMDEMTIFSKDGTRIYLSIHQLIANPDITDSAFDFDVNEYPDCYVEDLRID
jgi:outer membrane lipoprotein-sorting protein